MRSIIDPVLWRDLLPGQRSQLCIADAQTGEAEIVWESQKMVVEAPNWHPDGQRLLFNAAGRLYQISIDHPQPEEIDTPGLSDHNNDHLITRDGASILTSSEGTGHIYLLPFGGGLARRVSPDRSDTFSYFLQGLSPDGTVLSFAGATPDPDVRGLPTELYTVPLDGGPTRQWTHWRTCTVGFEWSPDSQWLYFNSERAARRDGDSQIFRMSIDRIRVEQLTHGPRVNWFPKVSPDGQTILYLSFPQGSMGHPANVHTIIRRLDPLTLQSSDLIALFGGQGTMNVNSFSPDSQRFAYVAYPIGHT